MKALTEDERQQFESGKYNMMEVMLLDSGRIVLCRPGRAIHYIINEWEELENILVHQLRDWNDRPTEYVPPTDRAVSYAAVNINEFEDDEMELRI